MVGGENMKNIKKAIDKAVSKAIKVNVNSTTSLMAFQPRVPKELKK